MEKPSPSPSPLEIQQLAELIKEANQAGDSATAFSASRLRACVEVGSKLIHWKTAIPRGEWGSFLGQHFPDLVERTSQRWMRLAEAEASGRLNLETARGLRHAYQLAGLLPDADSSNTKSSAKPTTWLVHLARLVAGLQHIVLDQLTPRDRNDLKARLKPVVDLYNRC